MPRMTTRRATRALAAIATTAIALTTAGCGLADPMSTQEQPAAKTTAAAVPVASSDGDAAVRRFADAYLDLLNGTGAPAERALRAAAAPNLADGLVLATQDAQLAGGAGTSASSRLIDVAPAAGGHWRATFATGATSWTMLVDVGPGETGDAIVTAAVTQPAS